MPAGISEQNLDFQSEHKTSESPAQLDPKAGPREAHTGVKNIDRSTQVSEVGLYFYFGKIITCCWINTSGFQKVQILYEPQENNSRKVDPILLFKPSKIMNITVNEKWHLSLGKST